MIEELRLKLIEEAKEKGWIKLDENIYMIEIKKYYDGQNIIEVQHAVDIVNIKDKWRLIVNNNSSDWTSYYEEILRHQEYFLATAYWEGTFPIEMPFKVISL